MTAFILKVIYILPWPYMGGSIFFVEGIEEVSEEEMGEREKYYIQKYNSLAPNGYNLAPGENVLLSIMVQKI